MRHAILVVLAAGLPGIAALAMPDSTGPTPPAATLAAEPAPDWRSAYEAWDLGRYEEALSAMQALLPAADAATLEAIALTTGELYVTSEITSDGRNPVFAGNTGLMVYERGGQGDASLHVVDVTGTPREVATFAGRAAAISADGRHIAYGDANGGLAWRLLPNGAERRVTTLPARAGDYVWSADGNTLFCALAGSDSDAPGLYAYDIATGAGRRIAETPALARDLAVAGAAFLRFTVGVARGDQTATHAFVDLATGASTKVEGALGTPAISTDGSTIAYVTRDEEGWALQVHAPGAPRETALRSDVPLDSPSFSPDGTRLVYQRMPREDWEVFLFDRASQTETRLTREIQHDVLPRFVSNTRVLALMGEPRHRRSHLYDLDTGVRRRVFHNNTVRTIAPEYQWQVSADGSRLLVQADRDGDTVSPARGVYVVDLTRTVSREALATRLRDMLASEQALSSFAETVTAPLADAIREVVGRASVSRVYGYQHDLFTFDSKHITQPGNHKAAEYLHAAYASFGYAPEYQWFDREQAHGGRTANVIATLEGTTHPEVIYVVSSHYDSVARGSGADDDSSGTAALLETARMLAGRPQPATIVLASFTGEEAGLLGSRHFVRVAADAGWRIEGALNNDMIGWANDHRLDNTIRYSNDGIRDIQHAVAKTFTDLITYDARYYRGTDAAAFYEAWGDIVGGIGSYPVLGNPHYHQPHDVLETINHRLVTEVAKTTAATLVMLANLPSRVRGLDAQRTSDGVVLTWSPAPERDVRGYIVTWTDANGETHQTRVEGTTATVAAAPDTTMAVAAVNARGLESWDRARVRTH